MRMQCGVACERTLSPNTLPRHGSVLLGVAEARWFLEGVGARLQADSRYLTLLIFVYVRTYHMVLYLFALVY